MIDFTILNALLRACEHTTGITIENMQKDLEWGTCPNKANETLHYMINKKIIVKASNDHRPTKWIKNRLISNSYTPTIKTH